MNKLNTLVSLIIPCYNMEKYIHRLLDSILCQTYNSLELIFVDDGSKDHSKEVIYRYKSKFEDKGYIFKYVYQENKGLSYALQTGLGYVTGAYLAWPDCDDYYSTPESIEILVNALYNSGPDVAIVRSQQEVIDEFTQEILSVNGRNAKEVESNTIFEDCLLGQNNYFYSPGSYLVDFQKLKKETDLKIYTSKLIGQNWQLLLPLYYHYKCITILLPLYRVLNRNSSDSRCQRSYEDTIKRYDEFYKAQIETLKSIKGMPMTDFVMYSEKCLKRYIRQRLWLAFGFCNRKDFLCFYKQMLQRGSITTKETLAFALLYIPGVMSIYKKLQSIKKNR